MKIGLLLGTFDPPHIGHIYLAVKALESGEIDTVWLVPAYKSPWKPNAIPYDLRAEMCLNLTKSYENIETSFLDEEIKSENTYQFLQALPKDTKFVIIAGDDVDITKWINGDWILKNFSTIRVSRGDFECSSTKIRNLIKEGKDPRPFLPQTVYNTAKNLYR